MLPTQLKADHFERFPPEAKEIATKYVALLRQLPLCFEPLLLRELIVYDWKFPVERKELDHQLSFLQSLSPEDLGKQMTPFAEFRLSPELERVDWVNAPAQFSQQLTAHLWVTHQIDSFRAAAVEYVRELNAASAAEPLPVPRFVLVMIGEGVASNAYPLFRKLRKQGVYFKNINPANGQAAILDALSRRASAHPIPFAHWYIDGGASIPTASDQLTCVSYAGLEPVCKTLTDKMRSIASREGPEVLRSFLVQMRPEEIGLNGRGAKATLNRFQLSLLTEGSGTQIFSTTFVQWTAREVLRRAQPLTLLARFAPRQNEQLMTEIVSGAQQHPGLDLQGSLIDADMGAYYTWLNLQRLSGSDRSNFLVWFENHAEAIAIGPSLARGTVSDTPLSMQELLNRITT